MVACVGTIWISGNNTLDSLESTCDVLIGDISCSILNFWCRILSQLLCFVQWIKLAEFCFAHNWWSWYRMERRLEDILDFWTRYSFQERRLSKCFLANPRHVFRFFDRFERFALIKHSSLNGHDGIREFHWCQCYAMIKCAFVNGGEWVWNCACL